MHLLLVGVQVSITAYASKVFLLSKSVKTATVGCFAGENTTCTKKYIPGLI